MQYVLSLQSIVPFALAVTAAIYFMIYVVLKKKRWKPSWPVILAEFILVGWFVVFIYVTQIQSFGRGLGELYNLQPLHVFYIAFRYGSNNAGMLWQFLLNILMFVSLGLLLTILFPKQYRTWLKILLISLCILITVRENNLFNSSE